VSEVVLRSFGNDTCLFKLEHNMRAFLYH